MPHCHTTVCPECMPHYGTPRVHATLSHYGTPRVPRPSHQDLDTQGITGPGSFTHHTITQCPWYTSHYHTSPLSTSHYHTAPKLHINHFQSPVWSHLPCHGAGGGWVSLFSYVSYCHATAIPGCRQWLGSPVLLHEHPSSNIITHRTAWAHAAHTLSHAARMGTCCPHTITHCTAWAHAAPTLSHTARHGHMRPPHYHTPHGMGTCCPHTIIHCTAWAHAAPTLSHTARHGHMRPPHYHTPHGMSTCGPHTITHCTAWAHATLTGALLKRSLRGSGIA